MMMKKGVVALAAGALVCTGLMGLRGTASAQQHAEKGEAKKVAVTKAVAILLPTKGSKVEGRITFTEEGGKVHVHGEITGLTPGKHGFHVHEYGVWSEDGMASGSHFNPAGEPHADREAAKRHVGDLGNITANENGKATIDVEDSVLTFHGAHSILGRGVVVHEKVDDFSQPVGNAGGRLAVGVIGVAKP